VSPPAVQSNYHTSPYQGVAWRQKIILKTIDLHLVIFECRLADTFTNEIKVFCKDFEAATLSFSSLARKSHSRWPEPLLGWNDGEE
jgi:hypothetical protein